MEYKDWPELAKLGLQHPGERGQHLAAVLDELVAEVERDPDSDAVGHIRAILDALPTDPALAEVPPSTPGHSTALLLCTPQRRSCRLWGNVPVGSAAILLSALATASKIITELEHSTRARAVARQKTRMDCIASVLRKFDPGACKLQTRSHRSLQSRVRIHTCTHVYIELAPGHLLCQGAS